MFPDDRVLVGVINRKRDLDMLLREHWYRIPESQMPQGVYTEYVAFFLSGSAARRFGASGIYYYGKRSGVELQLRHQLLPDEPNHKHANHRYYKVQLHSVQEKTPPLLNTDNRVISFIYTTWDRFVKAQIVADLYSHDDYFVDRIYHALRDKRVRTQRFWDAERRATGKPAHVRILCEQGPVYAATEPGEDVDVFIEKAAAEDEILARILAAMKAKGGPVITPMLYD